MKQFQWYRVPPSSQKISIEESRCSPFIISLLLGRLLWQPLRLLRCLSLSFLHSSVVSFKALHLQCLLSWKLKVPVASDSPALNLKLDCEKNQPLEDWRPRVNFEISCSPTWRTHSVGHSKRGWGAPGGS